MDDDFNTALAISEIFTFCHDLNSYVGAAEPPAHLQNYPKYGMTTSYNPLSQSFMIFI
jgi:hypothetical protein